MKMAQLSEATGIPVASIKLYLREGLLPAGERSGPNKSEYGDPHAERLHLIKALLGVGGLTIQTARQVLEAIDSEMPVAHTFDIAQQAVSAGRRTADLDEAGEAAFDQTAGGWDVSPGNPGRNAAIEAMSTFLRIQPHDLSVWFARYAEAAMIAAEADLDEIDARPDRAEKVETVVIGTTLGDALFSGLRRAAQEHVAKQRYNFSDMPHAADPTDTGTGTGNPPAASAPSDQPCRSTQPEGT